MTQRRLIEETFPLKKVSEDSKHEKNVRHGHISTLHIWPARRPLAACRAAIIAALMPDPGSEQERHALNKKIEAITRWGTENGPELDYFRKEIRKAYDGRAPRVLDMFAGGGDVRLARWDERSRNDLGQPHPSGGLPQIDMLHKLMQLWAAGNLDALNTYAEQNGLRQNELF
jgi:hypothetical protein